MYVLYYNKIYYEKKNVVARQKNRGCVIIKNTKKRFVLVLKILNGKGSI